jgi:putative ABC transport system substrate-binding protein
MRRRDFLKVIGGSATWPLAALAQQASVPVIGFLRSTTAADAGPWVAAFRQGLRESGYPPGKIVVEARWAEGHSDRLPKLATELASLPVAVIIGNTPAVLAAKKVTASIPIVFVTGVDPTTEKLVTSINHPGGNVTGVSFFDVPVAGKRLTLLRELVPNAEIVATLQDANFSDAQIETLEIETAAKAIGVKIVAMKASRADEIGPAFSTAVRSGAVALHVGAGPFLNSQRNQIIGLAAFHAIPASYFDSSFVDAGGLISYGSSVIDAYRRAGVYVARILKGEKPGDLPVEFPTKFELAINLRTARTLGLAVPPGLLARADHVIE